MKNSGLQNRFPAGLKYEWLFWNICSWCGENGWDALHHILSPSSRDYKDSLSNHSVLNSCPIHNDKCHLKNGLLHHREYEIKLMSKTLNALAAKEYQLKPIDLDFIKTYSETHYNSIVIPECYTTIIYDHLSKGSLCGNRPRTKRRNNNIRRSRKDSDSVSNASREVKR